MDGVGHREAPPATFTREELDAAEPERRPSTRRRWLVGIGIGALGGMYVGYPVGLLCLPFALTAAGSGALLGTGVIGLVGSAFTLLVWLNGDLADTPMFAAWWVGGLLSFVVGLPGSVVVLRRERARPA